MGLFLGGSSGGAIAGAKKLQLKQNDKVVIISADRGEKYLSTELFNK
jgi:cysteine synthase